MRTEQEILKDFEKLGYEVITNNKIGIILNLKTEFLKEGFRKNHYVELERIHIFKQIKSYKKYQIETINGHQVFSNKMWFSIQEHQLLHELFICYGWIGD